MNMMKAAALFLAATLATASQAAPPPLAHTRLLTATATGCRDVGLVHWRHPVREVFAQRDIPLVGLLLCNEDTYPVFFVHLPYDPQGQTTDYFQPLYTELRQANGGWPFALASTRDRTIVTVTAGREAGLEIGYERYGE